MSFDWSQWEPNTQLNLDWDADFVNLPNLPSLQNQSNQSNPNRLSDLMFNDGFPHTAFGCDTNLDSTPSHPTSDDAPYTTKGNSPAGSAERMLKQFMQHLEQQFAQSREENMKLFSKRLESLENE